MNSYQNDVVTEIKSVTVVVADQENFHSYRLGIIALGIEKLHRAGIDWPGDPSLNITVEQEFSAERGLTHLTFYTEIHYAIPSGLEAQALPLSSQLPTPSLGKTLRTSSVPSGHTTIVHPVLSGYAVDLLNSSPGALAAVSGRADLYQTSVDQFANVQLGDLRLAGTGISPPSLGTTLKASDIAQEISNLRDWAAQVPPPTTPDYNSSRATQYIHPELQTQSPPRKKLPRSQKRKNRDS